MRKKKDEYNDIIDKNEESLEKDLNDGLGNSIKTLMNKIISLPLIPNKKKNSSKENEIESELNARERQLTQKEKELSLREAEVERQQQKIAAQSEQNEKDAKKNYASYEEYKKSSQELKLRLEKCLQREKVCREKEEKLAEKERKLNEKSKIEEDKAQKEEQRIKEIYEKNEHNILVKEEQLRLNREIANTSGMRNEFRVNTLNSIDSLMQKIIEIRDSFFELNDSVVDVKKRVTVEYYYSTVIALCKFYRTLCTDDLLPYAQTLENILIHEYGIEKFEVQEGEIFNDKKHEKLDKSKSGSIIDSTIYEGWKTDDFVIIRAVVEVREEENNVC